MIESCSFFWTSYFQSFKWTASHYSFFIQAPCWCACVLAMSCLGMSSFILVRISRFSHSVSYVVVTLYSRAKNILRKKWFMLKVDFLSSAFRLHVKTIVSFSCHHSVTNIRLIESPVISIGNWQYLCSSCTWKMYNVLLCNFIVFFLSCPCIRWCLHTLLI